jgi:enoyl-CoA hydratase/carnithine racemase
VETPQQRRRGRLEAIYQIELPVIALIHGYAMGGAFGLLAMCDLRYAADDGVFAIPAA